MTTLQINKKNVGIKFSEETIAMANNFVDAIDDEELEDKAVTNWVNSKDGSTRLLSAIERVEKGNYISWAEFTKRMSITLPKS